MRSGIKPNSNQDAQKIVEYYSSVYLASTLLKQGNSKHPESLKRFGLLENLEKSFDFALLPQYSKEASYRNLKDRQDDSYNSSSISGASALSNLMKNYAESVLANKDKHSKHGSSNASKPPSSNNSSLQSVENQKNAAY